MENDRPNNNSEEIKVVQTRSEHWSNSRAEKPSALDVVYYDDRIKLQFAPELPANEQTEKRRYDYSHVVVTYLTRSKANQLADAFDKHVRPAIAAGEAGQVSVPISGVNQLMLESVVKDDSIPVVRLKLIKSIDPASLIADGDNVIYYEFNMGEYIVGYNEVNGTFKERVITYAELELFMNDLTNFVSAASNSYIHADRVVNRFWKDNLDDKLNKIGGAQGLDLVFKPRNNSATQGSIFTQKTHGESPVGTNVVSSVDDIELPFN